MPNGIFDPSAFVICLIFLFGTCAIFGAILYKVGWSLEGTLNPIDEIGPLILLYIMSFLALVPAVAEYELLPRRRASAEGISITMVVCAIGTVVYFIINPPFGSILCRGYFVLMNIILGGILEASTGKVTMLLRDLERYCT